MASEFQPYVGPRPFEREDQKRFFGRERESSELLSRVIAHPAVLLYSQSGAGKTSLLNASLIPLLENEGFEVLPTARVRGLVPKDVPTEKIPNLYVFNVLMSWAGGATDSRHLADVSIGDFLNSDERPIGREGIPAPRVAIFDQFEELFTFYPERWNDRQDFFSQIGQALERDRLMRIIFVMREDYIAELDPYVSDLPEKLRTRFRLERLREESALEAVTDPLNDTGYSFAPGVAERLINNLLKVPVETVAGVATVVGEFVEPVQLQVVCQTLWQKLDSSDTKVITQDQLEAFGDVDLALSDFYETAIANVTSEKDVNEGLLRRWFEHTLITPSGTRGTVFRGREETGGIPNVAVNKLVDRHLIRGELRGGARWYELTHDRLIEPIIASNARWMLQRSGSEQTRQRYEARAAEWFRNGRPASGLLDEAELLEARRWLESPNAADVGYSEALFALVQASRAAVEEALHERERLLFAEQQRRAEAEHARAEEQQQHIEDQVRGAKRLRLLAAALAVVLLLAIGTAVYAVNQTRLATKQTRLAEEKAREATDAFRTAKTQEKLASDQAIFAETQRQAAEDQTLLAETRKGELEKANQLEAAARKKAEKNAKAAAEVADLKTRDAEHQKADAIVSSANSLYRSDIFLEAIEKYNEALEIYRNMKNKNGEADMQINIAVSYLQLARQAKGEERKEKYAKSSKYFNDALELKKETSGAESDDVARILNYLGVLNGDQNRYAQAKTYYEPALAIRKKIKGDVSELALSYSNLGAAYSQLDQYPQAQEAYEQAFAIQRKKLPADNPGLVQSYNRVASIESLQGRHLKAEVILKNSLEILSKASSSKDTSLDRAATLNLLGLAYSYRGRLGEAAARYQEAIALNRQARGAGSTQEATNLHNLAVVTLGLANYAEAEAFEKSALAIYSKNLDQNAESMALASLTLARIRREQGKYVEADSLFNDALEKMKQAKGGEHTRIATISHYMAQFYAARHQYDKAEKFENEALAIYRNKLGPQHWYVARSLSSMATIYAGQGKGVEAERTYQESVRGLQATFGSDHPEIAYAVNGLAKLYIAQGKYDEAEPLVRRALTILEKMMVPEHPHIAPTLDNYASLLRKTNRETEAAAMEARARAIRVRYPQVGLDN